MGKASIALREHPSRRHGQGKHLLSVENVNARFTLTATFWFAQKEPKLLPPNTFQRLKSKFAIAAGDQPYVPTDPHLDFRGRFAAKIKGKVERAGGNGTGKEGTERKGRSDFASLARIPAGTHKCSLIVAYKTCYKTPQLVSFWLHYANTINHWKIR